MNTLGKTLLERAAIGTGVCWARRARLPSASALVLGYHDIIPAGQKSAGDASLHIAQHEFGRQLDVIASTHTVVPLASIFDGSPASGPRVAITFDDAYAGALTAGIEELTKRGLASTAFVAPGLLGEIPWWDILATGGAVQEELRNRALWQLSGLQDRVLSSTDRVSAGSRQLPLAGIGTLAQLSSAAASPLVTLASHTWSHANLAALPPDSLTTELVRPLEWLMATFARVLPMISYPYGLSNAAVEAEAARVGYEQGFRVIGGWMRNVASTPPLAVPRYNVPSGLSLRGLRLRLSDIGATT